MTKLIGGIMMAVGILVAGLSGLCSLIFLSTASSGDVGILLLLGGIPFAVGVGIFLLGRKILRSDGKEPAPPPA